ncbi:hypothetical protein LINPERPRIM_LOCUS4966 [Linum perenne]
MVEALICG